MPRVKRVVGVWEPPVFDSCLNSSELPLVESTSAPAWRAMRRPGV